jgi:hypothetical protein
VQLGLVYVYGDYTHWGVIISRDASPSTVWHYYFRSTDSGKLKPPLFKTYLCLSVRAPLDTSVYQQCINGHPLLALEAWAKTTVLVLKPTTPMLYTLPPTHSTNNFTLKCPGGLERPGYKPQ